MSPVQGIVRRGFRPGAVFLALEALAWAIPSCQAATPKHGPSAGFIEVPDPDAGPAIAFVPVGPAIAPPSVRPARPPPVAIAQAPAPVPLPAGPATGETSAEGPPLSVTIAFPGHRAGARQKAELVAGALRARGVPVDTVEADGAEAGRTGIVYAFEEDRPAADRLDHTLEAATGIANPLMLAPETAAVPRPGLIRIVLPG